MADSPLNFAVPTREVFDTWLQWHGYGFSETERAAVYLQFTRLAAIAEPVLAQALPDVLEAGFAPVLTCLAETPGDAP